MKKERQKNGITLQINQIFRLRSRPVKLPKVKLMVFSIPYRLKIMRLCQLDSFIIIRGLYSELVNAMHEEFKKMLGVPINIGDSV